MSAKKAKYRKKKKTGRILLLILVPLAILLLSAGVILLGLRQGKIINHLALQPDSVTLDPGGEQQLSILLAPGFVKEKTFTFVSGNPSVAEIDAYGNVTAKSAGETFVYVTHTASGKSAACRVIVNAEQTERDTLSTDNKAPEVKNVPEISLDLTEVTMKAGQGRQVNATYSPEYAGPPVWSSDDETVATVEDGYLTAVGVGTCTVTASLEDGTSASVSVTVEEEEEESQPQRTFRRPNGEGIEEVDGITYVDGILIANKTYGLPSDYCPGYDPDCRDAFYEMQDAAAADGINLWVQSGLRDYATQETLYNRYVARDGKAAADRYSARPGHSEHQTGLCYDVNSVDNSFADTAEGKWLAEHCWEYGFIIRYPKGGEEYTGYMYEPWHIRYLGKDLAKAVTESGLTLEQYLGITSQYQD